MVFNRLMNISHAEFYYCSGFLDEQLESVALKMLVLFASDYESSHQPVESNVYSDDIHRDESESRWAYICTENWYFLDSANIE